MNKTEALTRKLDSFSIDGSIFAPYIEDIAAADGEEAARDYLANISPSLTPEQVSFILDPDQAPAEPRVTVEEEHAEAKTIETAEPVSSLAEALKETDIDSIKPFVPQPKEEFPSLTKDQPSQPMFLSPLSFSDAVKSGATASQPVVAKKTAPSTEFLRRKLHLRPEWLDTGDTMNELYTSLRDEATAIKDKRLLVAQRGTQQFVRGNKANAKALGEEGKMLDAKMAELGYRASRMIFQTRNERLDRGDVVDLHGLHIPEALDCLDTAWWICASPSPVDRKGWKFSPHFGRSKYLWIVCGTGHHARGGRAHVLPHVEGWLEENGVAFLDGSADKRGGMLLADFRGASLDQ